MRKQGVAAGNAAAIANGGIPVTNGQGKGAKFRKLPAGGTHPPAMGKIVS